MGSGRIWAALARHFAICWYGRFYYDIQMFGGLELFFNIFPYIGNVIIPTDENY
jgi:hypothetical protein